MTFKQVLVQLIPPFVLTINRRLRNLRKKQCSEYKIGVHNILIPSNYCLPGFQKKYKLYDRFLPVLAKFLTTSDSIIDVGANIGDTTVSMAQNCRNPILCVEPSEKFLPFLSKNIDLINLNDNNRIKIINSFAGTGLFTGEIVHSSWGTATLNIEVETNKNTHLSLDSLVTDNSKVSLIKVDTDGFDFDVLNSAKSTIKNSEPILFWENQIFEEFQLKGYNELYDLLIKNGYTYLYIFDNYGNLMLEETDFITLKNLNTYIFSMEKNNCTRSLYYTDVLASTNKNHSIVKKAISEYKKEYIFK